jgi:hypothetical protein
VTSPRSAPTWLHALLAACGGFLLSTLWFDLMFDVQVVGHAAAAPLPEPVLESIAAYYRRVTTDAHPMGGLVGTVMMVTVLGTVATLRDPSRRWLGFAALLACAAPITLALLRIFPEAVRLGARAGSVAEQSALARSIFAGHVACLASIAGFTAIQVLLARSGRPD